MSPNVTSMDQYLKSSINGGGLSHEGKFSYGYASSPGRKDHMEDLCETRAASVAGQIVGLFGVFDGHGGPHASEYVQQNLFNALIGHPKFMSDTRAAVVDAYNRTDSEFLAKYPNVSDGSTTSTAVLIGDRLFVSNVGDSRAVICKSGIAVAATRDHAPNLADERRRIEGAGGHVTFFWERWRVNGVFTHSRSFGDRHFKPYVIVDLETYEETVDESVEFLIIASDGLWDVVSNEEAVAMVRPVEDPVAAAWKLLNEAFQRGSGDNITCVVVRFSTTNMW